MATYTEHYNLKKPANLENYNVEDANSNNDILDETLFGKQDKIPGKGLSTNDFTNEYKKKLDSLNNYDDTDIKDGIKNVVGRTETLEKDNKTNKEDISNLKKQDISQNKLIEQLQKRNALLESQIPTGTAEGENITIKDSSNMPFKKFEISGNDYQETREGYNLLIPPATQTKNGITFTVNKDNSITVNGTATADASINFENLSLEAGTYKLTGCPTGGSATTYRLGINLSGNNFDIGSGVTKTISEAVTDKKAWLVVYSGTTVNNLTFYPMLRKVTGEEDKPYEQYGAMPSIDYPSDVRACGDNVNIFSPVNLSNCSINNDGSLNNKTDRICTDYIAIAVNKTIALSVEDASLFMGLAYYDMNKTFISREITHNSTKLIGTIPNNTKYIRAFVNYENEVMNENSIKNHKIKLEKSSTSTPYSEPGQGNMTINKSNKNIFDVEKFKNMFVAGSFEIYNGVECFKIPGGSKLYPFAGKKNTQYTFQFNLVGYTNENIGGFQFLYDDGTYNPGIYPGSKLGKFSMTSEVNKTVAGVRWGAWSAGHFFYIEKNTMQLEEASSATEAIPHQGKTYIIPTQQPFYEGDTFVKIDGVRYEKHNFKGHILNGTENIILSGSVNGIYQFNITVDDLKIASEINYKNDVLSNGFGSINYWTNSWLVDNVVLPIVKEKKIRFQTSKYIATEEFKTELAEQHSNGTPIYIVYPLAEPILIPCTDEQNAVLDEIEQDENYKNITHIYSEDEISLICNIEYYKDLETMFNNLNTAIVSLGGV